MMTGYPVLPSGDPDEQAIYWLTLLTSGETGEAQQRAFNEWLAGDPGNQAAWAAAQSLWHDITLLSNADISEIDLTPIPKSVSLRPRRFVLSHPALSLAACLLLSTVLWLHDVAYYFADYHTTTGNQQKITLPDGSSIQLNTDTAISVDYTESARRLTLHGGEAWFNVTPDPDLPFEVTTEYGTVRALGTAFDVKNTEDAVSVTVYQHAVRVRLDNGEKIERLPEGTTVKFDRTIRGLNNAADLTSIAAWHEQRMVFRDRKLHDVVKELNRYRKGRILITDNALNDIPLSGTFDTNNPDEALMMIRESLGLKEYRITDRLVFLYQG
jgi:transmembrane sensor